MDIQITGEKIMFTYVELSNFKSFGKIKFDFTDTKKKSKNFIAIYGENGSGKTNFVSSVELLMKSITSLSDNYKFQRTKKLLEDSEKFDMDDARIESSLREILSFNELPLILKKCRMIDSEDISKATYGFLINGIEGYYSISFNDEILEEELYYLTNKQRGTLYKISRDENKINMNFSSVIFNDTNYKHNIIDMLNMYWGKHTFLSILLNELNDKNYNFVKERLSENLLKVLENFMRIFLLCKTSKYQHTGFISGSAFKFQDFENIEIRANDQKRKNQLKTIEKIIDDFYTQTYSDIVRVYYKVSNINKKESSRLKYELYVEKIIAGQPRTIPFSIESAGTQSILSVLRAVLEAVNGQTVVYDEIDNGIHDLLMTNILLSIQDEITGQFIITTHNTLLLENLNPKSAYVIYTDYDGNKDARCIADYDIRIQKSNNARKLYLDGVFGGIPYPNIDCSQMHINTKDKSEE